MHFQIDNLDNLTVSDIQKMVQAGTEESLHLEFKGADSFSGKGNKIARAISAFANSDGGLLIIGVAEDNPDDKTQGRITSLDPLPSDVQKEGFQQRLFAWVQPWPVGTYIKPLGVGNGKIFLVDVPGQSYPPVQVVNEGAYYIRLNFLNQPMPPNLVAAAFGKGFKPLLTPVTEIYGCDNYDDDEKGTTKLGLRITVNNTGRVAATWPIVLIERWDPVGPEMTMKPVSGKFVDISSTVHRDTGQPALQCTSEQPVYIGMPAMMGEIQLGFHPTAAIRVQVGSIECPIRTFRVELNRNLVDRYIESNGASRYSKNRVKNTLVSVPTPEVIEVT